MFSKYRYGRDHGASYTSPIRECPTPAHAAALQPRSQQRPSLSIPSSPRQYHEHYYNPAESSGVLTQSPIPRTPPGNSSADVTGQVDPRYSAMPTQTVQPITAAAAPRAGAVPSARTPPTQRLGERRVPAPEDALRYSPSASAEVQPQRMLRERSRLLGGVSGAAMLQPAADGAGDLCSSTACWLCAGSCLTGPGSTWPKAKPLFFTSEKNKMPVSTLTLCSTCAAAVSADPHATSREVLQRCQRTPVLRYRTSAYVNAVREYKLLLEVMSEKVLRACDRMRRIQGLSPQAFSSRDEAAICLDPDVDVSRAPLSSFSLPLQCKVLQQLLEALEELLRRDDRATQLAAAAIASDRKPVAQSRQQEHQREAGYPYSEVMAPRDRHVFLAEMAHVERQLAAVSAMNAEKRMADAGHGCASPSRASPVSHCEGVSPPQRGPSSGNAGHMREGGSDRRSYKDHIVASPRACAHDAGAPRSPLLLSSLSSPGGCAGGAADPLSMLADPRRAQYRLRASEAAHGDGDAGSNPRNRSPPALTSPQRLRGCGSGDVPTTDRGELRSAASPAPFPFVLAPHHDHNCSRSPVRAVDGESVGVREATRGKGSEQCSQGDDAGAAASQAPQPRRPSPAFASSGRDTMKKMMESALWAMYSRAPHNRGAEGGCHGNEEVRRETDATPDAPASNHTFCHKDPENILLNYFAGRSDVTPKFRISPARTSPLLRSARRPNAMSARSAPDNRCVVDASRDIDNGVYLVSAVDDDGGLRAQLEQERRRRREAEEALLETHARVAALELATNDMAEKLLTHRLSVTFRNHLEGMELLVRRWTLQANNFCLQKSLLFAEEAAVLVRAVQRDALGVAPLVRKDRRSAAASAEGREPTSGKMLAEAEEVEEELWVSRQHQDEHSGTDGAGGSNDHGASARRVASRGSVDPGSFPRSSSLHTVVPPTPEDDTGAAPYAFPSDLRLKPLVLYL
ncbi:hypothetical protein ABL78_4894 [Leptomonas seymouri]|uniref:Uncharacterized protein n=1 Tax=Leptomonas seymouri TaxID=5684 RepID=A0A0N0P552_LEPSE|nr:hypothetical protein ABL78_4894 [Leptomonas seymouri]|eukprot:KPI86056.1 hypothetical protein ABL78_4894 [Leptomonas seymouri]